MTVWQRSLIAGLGRTLQKRAVDRDQPTLALYSSAPPWNRAVPCMFDDETCVCVCALAECETLNPVTHSFFPYTHSLLSYQTAVPQSSSDVAKACLAGSLWHCCIHPVLGPQHFAGLCSQVIYPERASCWTTLSQTLLLPFFWDKLYYA